MSIRETLSDSIALAVINNFDQGAVAHISTVFGPVSMFLAEGATETGLFRHSYNHVFGVRNFGNTKSMSAIVFSTMFKL